MCVVCVRWNYNDDDKKKNDEEEEDEKKENKMKCVHLDHFECVCELKSFCLWMYCRKQPSGKF